MRDVFEEIFAHGSLDPMKAAQRSVRPQVHKRFYTSAAVGEGNPDVGFPILLDGRGVRTPARNLMVAPTAALAQAITDEWARQGEFIEPARMPLTRLANTVIDGVAAAPQPVADEIAKYAGSDLLVYRAEEPEGLVALQAQHWDPVLAWARESLGAQFILSAGVMFVTQPERAIAAVRAAIPRDVWRLAAVSTITTLTGSALLALAVAQRHMPADAAWAAAHVDEDWQISQWGEDAPASERRAARRDDMQAAATVLEHVPAGEGES